MSVVKWIGFCTFLPPLPKEDRTYVFTPVCLSVCLFVFSGPSACEQDISKSCGRIWTKLDVNVVCGTRTNCLDFDEDLDPDPD